MANEKNLIPNSKRSPTEVRENGRKGGKASGKSRREKRTIQEIVKAMLESEASTLPQFAAIAKKLGLESNASIKEVYAWLVAINGAKTANWSDLEKMQKLSGEQPDMVDTDEQKQEKAHSELIKALKERRADED